MEQLLSVPRFMDNLRAQCLQVFFRSSTLRFLYRNKIYRTQILFLLSCIFYFFIALRFPLELMYFSPLLFGIPHVFSSARYVASSLFAHPALVEKKNFLLRRAIYFFIAIWLGSLALLFLEYKNIFQISLFYTSSAVIFSAGIGAFFLARTVRASLWSIALKFSLFFAFVWAAWNYFVPVMAGLALLHNWIAFYFWDRAAKNKKERLSVLFAFAVFILIHLLILSPVGTYLIYYLDPLLEWNRFDISTTGFSLAPWANGRMLWTKITTLFVFSQSIHYFIWLKAIPDYELPWAYPSSFRSSFGFLRRDFGLPVTIFVVAVSVFYLGTWWYLDMAAALALYQSVAFTHGFVEIGGIFAPIKRQG